VVSPKFRSWWVLCGYVSFMYVCGSSMHQKCSNHALTNLLFKLCRFVWIIDMLVIHPSPHPKTLTRLFTPKCYELMNVPQFLLLLLFSFLDSHLSLSRSVGGVTIDDSHGNRTIKMRIYLLKKAFEIICYLFSTRVCLGLAMDNKKWEYDV